MMTQKEEEGKLTLSLVQVQEKENLALSLSFEEEEPFKRWKERLADILNHTRTHGVDIRSFVSNHPLVRERIGPGRLELSVWDFAGQHEYYNSHHFFLQARAVYLVVWKLGLSQEEDEKQLRELRFWLRSLSIHLPRDRLDINKKPLFSVFVVGTHLDLKAEAQRRKEEKRSREERVLQAARECNLTCPIIYHEVSAAFLQGIASLEEAVLEAILSHSYMGEVVPETYLNVESVVLELREKKRGELAICRTKEILEKLPQFPRINTEVLKRALSLLAAWGTCCYFEEPPELSDLVVLDPRLLAKEVLAQIFSVDPILGQKRASGIIHHSDLKEFWSALSGRRDFRRLCVQLMKLMQQFEVCFILEEDLEEAREGEAEARPPFHLKRSQGALSKHATERFFRQKSIIPSLLPELSFSQEERRLQRLRRVWPEDPPFNRRIQLQRIIAFNVIPVELVGRLLVRLHQYIQEGLIWRYDVVIMKEGTQGWISVDVVRNRFLVTLRSSNRHHCCELMHFLLERVRGISSLYPGVTWWEGLFSPHDPDALIDLRQVQEREPGSPLFCPETLLPIDVGKMLVKAGLEDHPSLESVSTREILGQQGTILDPSACQDLAWLLSFFHGSLRLEDVDLALHVTNPELEDLFQSFQKIIAKRHEESPSLFKRNDWKNMERAAERKETLLQLNRRMARFRPKETSSQPEDPPLLRKDWNNGRMPFVIPMVQGTSEDAAWKITRNGFGTLSKTDPGFYGKGVYFTSDLGYALRYAPPLEGTGAKMLLISLVTPGNIFPVVEEAYLGGSGQPNPHGFLGLPCKQGYQAHYVLGLFFLFF